MNNFKKTLAGISALTLSMSMTACGGDSSDNAEESATVTTTTAVTVEINTATVAEEDQATLDQVADEQLRDVELENKTIKWLAHYDINPTTSGNSESIPLNLFKSKYGGSVEWVATTWETRYSDLSTHVLGGDGIDFFPCDTAALPKGIISGMFQPVDDYIDLSSDLWSDVSSAMDIYSFNGKHYELVTNVTAEAVVIYNKQTIEEQGFDDPWELYQNGEWNWDTFTKMLEQFCDPDADQWGLDGFWAEKALFLSAGVPSVSTSDDGSLITNLSDATVEKAMNWMYDLYNKGLVMDRSLFDWAEQPQFMGEGKELFYIVGAWAVQSAPETWSTKISPENLGLAPVPSPADSDPYQGATLDGWVICKGAANPEGVGLFADCTRLANSNDEAIAIGDKKTKEDYQWTDELIAINKEINALAQKYPVVDLATGVSTDVASLTTDGGDGIGLRAALHGVDWATNREEISEVVEMLVAEADEQIKSVG